MLARFGLIAATLMLAACGSDRTGALSKPMLLGGEFGLATPRTHPVAETVQKAQAGKVLSAIAFERVTGLKTDPARLISRP